MEEEAHIHRARGMVASIVTVLVLIVLGVFTWRVIYFTDLIRSQGADLTSYDFSSRLTRAIAIASAPVSDKTVEIATIDDPHIGNSNALITIVEFADFECEYSRESSLIMRELAAKYPEQIHYVYRDFPLSQIHPLALTAAQAGECAHEQGKFWEYHDKIYQNQSRLSDSALSQFALELNLNKQAFDSCLESGRYKNEVLEDLEAGASAGVSGTPTFFINGNMIAGAIPFDIFDEIVHTILIHRSQKYE